MASHEHMNVVAIKPPTPKRRGGTPKGVGMVVGWLPLACEGSLEHVWTKKKKRKRNEKKGAANDNNNKNNDREKENGTNKTRETTHNKNRKRTADSIM